jgi:nucleoid DNA-binding protein
MNTKDLVIAKIQAVLSLPTKKEAENVLNEVLYAIEQTLLDNLDDGQFSLKLNSLGKFTVRHKKSILRKIPWSGVMHQTKARRKVKFVSLGPLREQEVKQ